MASAEPVTSRVWTNAKMDFRMVHQYRGRVKMVVFDWAGTVVDCGVFAPVRAFTNVFKAEGIEVLDDEVRAPMGRHKREHIAQMLQVNRIASAWEKEHGGPSTQVDVERMYKNFLPELIKSLPVHANVIAGVPESVRRLREDYMLKIGTSTGFTSEITNHLVPLAAKMGFEPDYCASADQVKEARPTPSLLYMNMINLNVHPIEAVVKVDDTVSGIMEGLSGGCWTVGVARTGNYMASTEDDLANMPREEHDLRLRQAYKTLTSSGAHYVIDSVNDIFPVIDDINRRLALGEKP